MDYETYLKGQNFLSQIIRCLRRTLLYAAVRSY